MRHTTVRLLVPTAAGLIGFGVTVALDGDTLVIGATGDDDNGSASGSAYVFVRAGGAWTQQAKLRPSDGAASDIFGHAVALDGDTALISARFSDANAEDFGAAYVFTRSGGVWTEQAVLPVSDAQPFLGDYGASVAIEGDTAMVGAPDDRDNGPSSGAVYWYEREGGSWQERANHFGEDAVAVAGDTALVGARRNDDYGENAGAAWVFELEPGEPTPALGAAGAVLLVVAMLGGGAWVLRRRSRAARPGR